MAEDWRNWFRSWSHQDTFAHPDSPTGGSGSGFSRSPGYSGYSWSPVPHPNSPAGRRFDWNSELPRLQLEEHFTKALQGIDRAAHTSDLVRLARSVLGPESFDLGVCYGIAENAAGMASAFLGLAKIFVLAGLYDAANLPGWSAGPLIGVRAEANIAKWVFGPAALKDAHDQRDTLVQELRKAALHPIELVGTAAKSTAQEYTSKWRRFQQVMGHASLAANFEAGRIFGGVLVDVLILISTVGDMARAAKVLAEIPELVRLSKGMKAVGTAAGALIKDESGAVRIGKAIEEGKVGDQASKIRREAVGVPKEPPPAVLRTVSAAQIDLAGSLGESEAQIAARKAVAEAFYREHGFDEARIKSELMGIDFQKPVKARLSPPPEETFQWQPKGVQGRYFGSVEENAAPKQMGVGEFGRDPGDPSRVVPKVQSLCKIKAGTPVLQSTATGINDTWSVRRGQGTPFTMGDQGMVQGTSGGATQYFIPDKSAVSIVKQ
jgi:Bacterial toxin 46